MKYSRILTALPVALILAFAVSGTALAEKDHHKKHGDKSQWSDFRMIQTERHAMIRGLMEVTRDLTNILANLNHKPSANEKEALNKMGKRLSKLIEKDDELSRKMAGKWKKKWSGDKDKDDD